MKTLLLCSGGVDSSTLLYKLCKEGVDKIHCVFVHYGSRPNEREYRAFLSVIKHINHTGRISMRKIHVDFNALGITSALMQGSEIPIPKEGDNDVSITKTVVPLRNGIMLCIASAIAESMEYDAVAIAAHKNDEAVYPDCRPNFMEHISKSIELGTYRNIKLITPFLDLTKKEIVSLGNLLEVPYALTYSCYEGRERHCGKCSTCLDRKNAFGKNDPTLYE